MNVCLIPTKLNGHCYNTLLRRSGKGLLEPSLDRSTVQYLLGVLKLNQCAKKYFLCELLFNHNIRYCMYLFIQLARTGTKCGTSQQKRYFPSSQPSQPMVK